MAARKMLKLEHNIGIDEGFNAYQVWGTQSCDHGFRGHGQFEPVNLGKYLY